MATTDSSNSISFTIPENGQGGINAMEAKDGVVVWFDLSQSDAQAGDTITLHWGKKTVTMVLQDSDLATLSAVAFTVPAKLIAQRGNGKIQVEAEWASQDGQSTAAADPLTVTVDTRAPGAPSIVAVAENGNGGINAAEAADGTTVSVRLGGKAKVGDTLAIHWGDQTIHYRLTARDIAGHKALVPLTADQVAAPGDGQFNLTAQLTDRAGNVSPLSAAKVVTLDTSIPTATLSTLALSSDTGSHPDDFITRSAAQTIRGTLNGLVGAGESVQVSLDNGAHWKTAELGSDGKSWSLNANLQSGNQILLVQVVDGVGNHGPTYRQPYVLDTRAPIALIDTARLSADTGGDAADFITNVANQAIRGTLVGKVGGSDLVRVSLDNGTTWQTAILGADGGSWSLADSVTLLPGSHTLLAQVVDAAGNEGQAYSQIYVLDSTAPTATVNSVAFSADTGDSAFDFVTNTARQTLGGTVQGKLSKGDTVQVSLDDGAHWQNATLSFNNWTLEAVTLSGSGTLQARVVDAAGNASPLLSQPFVLDTTPPKAVVGNVDFSEDSGRSADDHITNVAAQTLSGGFTGTLGAGEKVQVSLDNGQTWQTAKVDGNQWSLDATLLAGSNSVQVWVADMAGNAGPTHSQAYVLDLAPPTTTVTSVNFNPDNTGTAQTIRGALSANLANGESVLVSLDDGVNWKVAKVNANQWSLSNVQLLPGGHTLMAAVVDAAGNHSAVWSSPYGTPGDLPSLSIADLRVDEGNASHDLAVSVTLSAASDKPVTVNYASADGTALAGQDYAAVGGTLSFAAGETSKTIVIPIVGDSAVEPDESFQIALSGPVNAVLDGTHGTATVTLVNDDDTVPSPEISMANAVVTEGEEGTVHALVTVTLSEPGSVPVTVNYSSSDGTALAGQDYSAVAGTLTFAVGETTRTILVPVFGDTTVEPDESFQVVLADPANAVLAGQGSATVTIANDDFPQPEVSFYYNAGHWYLNRENTISASLADVEQGLDESDATLVLQAPGTGFTEQTLTGWNEGDKIQIEESAFIPSSYTSRKTVTGAGFTDRRAFQWDNNRHTEGTVAGVGVAQMADSHRLYAFEQLVSSGVFATTLHYTILAFGEDGPVWSDITFV